MVRALRIPVASPPRSRSGREKKQPTLTDLVSGVLLPLLLCIINLSALFDRQTANTTI